MYKKLLGISLIAIFLIISVGVISAANDTISVKIIWDDNAGYIPKQVTVDLLKMVLLLILPI